MKQTLLIPSICISQNCLHSKTLTALLPIYFTNESQKLPWSYLELNYRQQDNNSNILAKGYTTCKTAIVKNLQCSDNKIPNIISYILKYCIHFLHLFRWCTNMWSWSQKNNRSASTNWLIGPHLHTHSQKPTIDINVPDIVSYLLQCCMHFLHLFQWCTKMWSWSRKMKDYEITFARLQHVTFWLLGQLMPNFFRRLNSRLMLPPANKAWKIW